MLSSSPLHRLPLLALGAIAVVSLHACAMQQSTTDTNPQAQTTSTMMASSAMHQQGVMVGGALMTPDRTIVANALNASNVTTLVAAVKAAGLVETLSGPGPFTVFAPTNDAFAKLPAGTVDMLLKPENKEKLIAILAYHVVPGHLTAADLQDGQTLKTVQGEMLTIKKQNGKVWVNGSAMIETPDVISSNGVTHVIDTVLLPK